MQRWWVLCTALAALTGCDKLLDLRDLPDATIPPDAYESVPGCSPMSLIQDDFDSPSNQWLRDLNGSPATNLPIVQNGALHAELSGVGVDGNGYATISSYRYFDLRDDSITFELTDSGLQPTDSIALDLLPIAPNTRLRIRRAGSTLEFWRFEPTAEFKQLSIPYDATQHRFLRIANRADVTTFETSTTGGDDYAVLATMPGLAYIGWTKLEIMAQRTPTGGMFSFDLHSIHGGASTIGACPIVQLADDFSQDTFDEQWGRNEVSNGTITPQNGVVEISFNPNGAESAMRLRPTTIYDLREGSLSLEIPQMSDTSTNQIVELRATSLDGRVALFRQYLGMLRAESDPPYTLLSMIAYDADAHRWWRFREAAGTLYWEVSPDGRAYTVVGQLPDFTGLEAADVAVRALGVANVPTVVKIDNINTPPAP